MSNTTIPPAPSSQVVDKANWDSAQTKYFLDLCVKQVKEGRRSGSHFTKEGWQKIVARFAEKTRKRYDQPELKNKWDNLKKEHILWKKLQLHNTGTRWDSVRNTILADNDWWERRIQLFNVGI
ncbi:L10-interacting MYB domain-containing protein-like [Tripterygium wilfordii]|uniref:L10-interacting MYB domain-containing protein-like n=1 Tax=Tripterygium wilfordii TaxID=458696 RepID=UPI0018F82B72|nr:L10-interacting MYB domain-containing protein-like [Tripterygium wilfordii]